MYIIVHNTALWEGSWWNVTGKTVSCEAGCVCFSGYKGEFHSHFGGPVCSDPMDVWLPTFKFFFSPPIYRMVFWSSGATQNTTSVLISTRWPSTDRVCWELRKAPRSYWHNWYKKLPKARWVCTWHHLHILGSHVPTQSYSGATRNLRLIINSS